MASAWEAEWPRASSLFWMCSTCRCSFLVYRCLVAIFRTCPGESAVNQRANEGPWRLRPYPKPPRGLTKSNGQNFCHHAGVFMIQNVTMKHKHSFDDRISEVYQHG